MTDPQTNPLLDLARRALQQLPPSAQDRLRAARTLIERDPVPPPAIDFPEDVADREAVRAYLGSAHVFDDDAEAHGYLTDALDRFRITMALVPELGAGAKVLELGANPYFLTRLLRRRRLDVTCANYFGPGFDAPLVQTIAAPDGDEVFEFDHFNIEAERFPYDDHSFDLVLFCEILEHLPADPIHTLAEIHRVTKPGGTVIVTTPNASRLTNLIRIWRGENVYEDLSGYGTYGRHNREYTVDELTRLLAACGYDAERVFAIDLHPHEERLPAGVGAAVEHRGDNLFAVARPHGEPRWAYPSWLYSSRHAIRRVVRPDFLAGHNDTLQGSGFWEPEVIGDLDVCWMGSAPESTVTLSPSSATTRIRLQGMAPPPAAGATISIEARAHGEVAQWSVECTGEPFDVSAPFALAAGPSTVTITADPLWTPVGAGMSADARTLGVAVHRVTVT